MEKMFPSLKQVFRQRESIIRSKGPIPSGKVLGMMEQAKGGDDSGFSLARLIKEVKDGGEV